jgi:acylphosphatase
LKGADRFRATEATMAREERKAVLLRVEGRVQGVGFRVWARDEAERLGLDGWVRNEPDGSVRAHLEGAAAAVSAMLERLRAGPPGAAVTAVTPKKTATGTVGRGFRITR